MKLVRSGLGVVAVWLALPALATAAFPGRNGMLAVQPLHGHGVVLVLPSGGSQRRICTNVGVCGHPRRPRFSPDGRSVVFSGPAIHLIGTDGTCQNCQFGVAQNPAFLPDGTLVSFVSSGLAVDGIDGLRAGSLLRDATDAVWSATGKLAVVDRRGRLLVGRARLDMIGRGSSPSWSPGGTRLAIVRGGWITIVRLSDRSVRRLARGTAPAFSPDGRWIAYIDPRDRVRVISSFGGRARVVPGVRGVAVDWQPVPSHPTACIPPPGSNVIARSDQAVVTSETSAKPEPYLPATAAMGCLLADGRERLLGQSTFNTPDGATDFPLAVTAGTYAALEVHSYDPHYGGDQRTILVYDLRTGRRSRFGGEQSSCDYPATYACTGIDQVVLGPDGVSAVHVDGGRGADPLNVFCASASLCLAFNPFGDLASSTDPNSGPWNSIKLVGAVGRSCPSVSLCVLTWGSDIYTSTNPAGGADAWSLTKLPSSVTVLAIDCPSTTFCVGTTRDGQVVVSNNPTGDASAWSIVHVDGDNEIFGIACPTTSECVATDNQGNVISSTDPTGGPSAWTVRKVASSSLGEIRCPSMSFCIAGGSPHPLVSDDPTGGRWAATTGPALEQLECPSASLCAGIDSSFEIATSTAPASGGWTSYPLSGAGTLESLSCPTTSFCAAAGYDNGDVLISRDPTRGPSTWTPVFADKVSCQLAPNACGTEQIIASDRTGLHALDSSTEFEAQTGQQLTGLALSGDTLGWNHAGAARNAQLTP